VSKQRNEDTGEFQEVYSDDRIREVLRDTRLSTTEVAGELNCHRTTAHRKLRELETEGEVESTQVGNTILWEL
jgi:predicted ArsR family transcriptional regulator